MTNYQDKLKITKHLLSKDIIKQYITSNDGLNTSLERYIWNVKLCESLYPSIHYFEILLRNQISRSISRILDNDEWLISEKTSMFNSEQKQKIEKALEVLKEKEETICSSNVIRHLNLGFWVKLFNANYDIVLWHQGLEKKVFPFLKPEKRKRSVVLRKLKMIHIIRNRIAHHEPIWNYHPDKMHNYINELINGMTKTRPYGLDEVDRFYNTWNQGAVLLPN